MKYGLQALPRKYLKTLPHEIIEILDNPICTFRDNYLVSFDVKTGRQIKFTVDSYEGPISLFHEIAHFVSVPEDRCGISSFGFQFKKKHFVESKDNWPAIHHEAEVFARERNIVNRYNTPARTHRDEILILASLPGRSNWLRSHKETLAKECDTLIRYYQKQESCSTENTLKILRARLELLSRETWRIQKKRLQLQ